jgi:hypothetical protein
LDTKKRPTVRIGGFLCFGSREVDAINYYTKEVAYLNKEIEILRKCPSTNNASYGWIKFKHIEWAHAAVITANKSKQLQLSPTCSDLIWHNLQMNEKKLTVKGWIGHGIYLVLTIIWMIFISALSTSSNAVNFVSLFPDPQSFMGNHQLFVSLIKSYFTPITMVIFFYLVPIFFRSLSEKQGYTTHTALNHGLLTKLYVFFIVSNLLLFSLGSILIDAYGQLRAGNFTSIQSISEYIMCIAKNIADISTFWINFVCLNSLTLVMDLATMWSLIASTIKKSLTHPTPRELREMAQPPPFDFLQKYNLSLFLFTIALVYSAMSPLILPFALVYFSVAESVHKCMLMYICATKIESGGKIGPILYRMVTTSVLFFQLIMITILWFKGGLVQVYCLIPLPILTLVYQYVYYRRMLLFGSYKIRVKYVSCINRALQEKILYTIDNLLRTAEIHLSIPGRCRSESKSFVLKNEFQDPAYHGRLPVPTVHDDVKCLLQKVYQQPLVADENQKRSKETFQQYGRNIIHGSTVEKGEVFHRKNYHQVTFGGPCLNVKFATATESEIQDIDSNSYEGQVIVNSEQ